MAILSRRNQPNDPADSNANAVLWDFVQDLITQGWRVLGSGDGETFENDGQTAGSTGLGAGGGFDLFATRPPTPVTMTSPTTPATLGREGLFANISGFPDAFGSSWWRIATPADATHYAEFLFQLNITGGVIDEQFFIAYCRGSQRFDSGADEWQRPTVNTGTALRLGTNITAEDATTQTPATFLFPSTVSHSHWVIGDASIDYDFHMIVSRDNYLVGTWSGEVFANFGRLRLVGGQPRSDESADPDPFMLIAAFEASSSNTNHNLTGADLVSADTSVPATHPERLEDRVASPGSIEPQIIVSWGIDDPAIDASRQGHYAAHFMLPSVDGTEIYLSDAPLGFNIATGRTIVDTFLKVGRASTTATIVTRFFKGVVKNDLIGMSSRGSALPVVERGPDPSDPFRVVWGRFHFYWGAEERIVGF